VGSRPSAAAGCAGMCIKAFCFCHCTAILEQGSAAAALRAK
jgi:hypothetical protein